MTPLSTPRRSRTTRTMKLARLTRLTGRTLPPFLRGRACTNRVDEHEKVVDAVHFGRKLPCAEGRCSKAGETLFKPDECARVGGPGGCFAGHPRTGYPAGPRRSKVAIPVG